MHQHDSSLPCAAPPAAPSRATSPPVSPRSAEHAPLLRARPAPPRRRRAFGVVLAAALFAGGALAAAPSTASAQPKLAVIDMRRAVLETEEGLRVQATLKKLFDSRQKEISDKEIALEKEKDDLNKAAKSGKVPQQTLQQRYEILQKQVLELQTLAMDAQREMQRKESELTSPILSRIMSIVRRIAAQDGYEMILEKAAVPYFRSDLELTDRAIQMYNSGQVGDAGPAPKGQAPAGGVAPAPAKQPAPAPKKK